MVRERASDGVDNGTKRPPIVDVNSDVDHAIATYDLHTIHSIINETPVLHVRIFAVMFPRLNLTLNPETCLDKIHFPDVLQGSRFALTQARLTRK